MADLTYILLMIIVCFDKPALRLAILSVPSILAFILITFTSAHEQKCGYLVIKKNRKAFNLLGIVGQDVCTRRFHCRRRRHHHQHHRIPAVKSHSFILYAYTFYDFYSGIFFLDGSAGTIFVQNVN